MNNQLMLSIKFAIIDGKFEEVEKLVTENHDALKRPGHYAVTHLDHCLHYSVSTGAHQNLEMTKFLMQKGAKINSGNNHLTALHSAVSSDDPKIMKFLLENGAKIEARNVSGYTPLMLAAAKGKFKAVKYLIDSGAQVNAENEQGENPFDVATFNHHLNIAEYLRIVKKMASEKDECPENINNRAPCLVCLTPRNGLFVLLPCGHVSLCELCCFHIQKLNKGKKCPSCREKITDYKKLFFQQPE